MRARLADARFFWDQDRKIRLEDRVEALKDRVYHEKLGSVYDKVERMEKLAGFLAEGLYSPVTPAQAGVQGDRSYVAALDSRIRGNDDGGPCRLAQRAANLAKADLSTGMVGEFPELQGIIGALLRAVRRRGPREVADAVADHYKPLGPNDACPTAPVSVIVALADKIDTLVAFFAIGERPTGSRDPFALRRAALGLIRLVLENKLRLQLKEIVFRNASMTLPPGSRDPSAEVLEFVADRLKVHLREQGTRHDLIAAAFAQIGQREDDLVRLLARVDALRGFVDSEDGANLLTAYRRAANIVAIEEKKDGRVYGGLVDRKQLQQREEDALAQVLSIRSARRPSPCSATRNSRRRWRNSRGCGGRSTNFSNASPLIRMTRSCARTGCGCCRAFARR